MEVNPINEKIVGLHHGWWDEVQKYSMIPVMILVFYRFFFGVWDLSKYYIPETLGSHWEALRFLNLRNLPVDKKEEEERKEKYKDKKILNRNFIDYLYFLYITTGIPYYTVDIIFKFWYYGWSGMTICEWSYIYHHFFTCYFYKFYGSVYYFTWYFMLPSAYHSVLITFPKFYWNFHIYGVSLFLFTVANIFFENLRSTRNHKHLFLSCFVLLPPLVLIALYKCQE